MPQLLTRLTRQLASKGNKNAKGMAIAILKKNGQLNDNGELTAVGKKRQALGKAGRAKDRAAKYSGGKASEYKYNSKTNRATKKK
jgi:hypothetical protein